MHSACAILVQVIAAACVAVAPGVGHATNDPAATAPPAVAGTNAANPVVPPHRLDEDDLRGLLEAFLNQRRTEGVAEWEVHLTRPWTPLVVPDAPLTIEILEPALNRITSSCILKFELRAGPKTIGSWQAPVQARLWQETLVARRCHCRTAPAAALFRAGPGCGSASADLPG